MATVSGNSVLRVGGNLVANPTNLAGTSPEYGGTNLGAVSACYAQRNVAYGPIVSEERNEVVEQLYLGETWTFTAVLRQWDFDVLSTIFPNITGTTNSDVVVTGRGSVLPGYKLSSDAIKLLWVPRDETNHPAIYFPRAIPAPEEMSMYFSILREHTYLVNFVAIADGSARTAFLGNLSDLTL